VCNPTGQYEFGFRTSDKSKIKPRQTDEFECIDQYWNKGKMSNQTTLICKNKEGKTFHVKLKGNNQQREEWARNFDEKVKGKLITIEYRKLSKYNTPIEGVGVAIRDYE
jgi:ATP-dependent DNA ligase